MTTTQTATQQAAELINRVARGCSQPGAFGNFSDSIYDVAWVSMITKSSTDGSVEFLFPECFSHLLQRQENSGGWTGYASHIDGILNTLTGTLALQKRIGDGIRTIQLKSDLSERVMRATAAVQEMLQAWDVDDTQHVGFEILVPTMLRLLGASGIDFDFPGKQRLFDLYDSKMRRLPVHILGSQMQTTALHSLEGFVGMLDFDSVRHHCTEFGGMLGSPASTAAYLMNTSTWDPRAETYLRRVFHYFGSSGQFPSGFPSSLFESSWILSTFLSHGIDAQSLGLEETSTIANYINRAINEQGGIVGFAPGFLPDADDTARALLTLQLLQYPADPRALIKKFFHDDHFRTYDTERNPSFSANCNVLLCLLAQSDPLEFSTEIRTAANFLHDVWSQENLQDKWNLRREYSEMLLGQGFVDLLGVFNSTAIELGEDFLKFKLLPTLCGLLSSAFREQASDGSWSQSCEVTAYRALLLVHLKHLPWPEALSTQIKQRIQQSRTFLYSQRASWSNGEYIWIEKVTYKSTILAECYCLAAVAAPTEVSSWNSEVLALFSVIPQQQKLIPLLRSLPVLKDVSTTTFLLALIEAQSLSLQLSRHRLDIFPRDQLSFTSDKYLQYIPVLWTVANQRDGVYLNSRVLFEMAILSMRNYQADEYMETVVSTLPESSLELLESSLGAKGAWSARELTSSQPSDDSGAENLETGAFTPPNSEKSCGYSSEDFPFTKVMDTLQAYMCSIQDHPSVTSSRPDVQSALKLQLRKFLSAHLAHNRQSKHLRDQLSVVHTTGNAFEDNTRNLSPANYASYFDWVRSTGADDTSCPFSFAFFCCLISGKSGHVLSSPKARYIGQSLAASLATMCRQYNDVGSRLRDQAEGNLNSLDFEELSASSVSSNGCAPVDTLMEIAEFERSGMEHDFTCLSREIDKEAASRLRTFITVTDLFGQLYVAKDVASRRTD